MTSVETILARARTATGHDTLYWIGTGGLDPTAALPSAPTSVGKTWPTLSAAQKAELLPLARAMGLDVDDPTLVRDACDCSGFVCWALGFTRHPSADVWINTDSIWADAMGSQRRFQMLGQARPGALIVYPKPPVGENYGHVGIVMEADGHGKATLVAHCSADNIAAAPYDAIKITTPEKFEQQAATIYAWCRDVAA